MTTVISRTVRTSPYRDSHAAWLLIVDLLTRGKDGQRRTELLSVAGIAASVIADKAAEGSPIVAVCDGPRTRIYCLYDEDALDEAKHSEAALGFDALAGDWTVSLSCSEDDLAWVQAALKKKTSRVVARGEQEGFAVDEQATAANDALKLDIKEFLAS
jgi:hypothetical protein